MRSTRRCIVSVQPPDSRSFVPPCWRACHLPGAALLPAIAALAVTAEAQSARRDDLDVGGRVVDGLVGGQHVGRDRDRALQVGPASGSFGRSTPSRGYSALVETVGAL